MGIKNLRWNRPATPLRWVPPSGAIRAQRAAHYARLSYVPQALSGPKTGPGRAGHRTQACLVADDCRSGSLPIARSSAWRRTRPTTPCSPDRGCRRRQAAAPA
ncbi:hypothetical protein XFF6970_140055 [Xanthomonas citri pv. fuscans]|nr:hypothetical protein XFF6970_140055 [Xanthomonas citri pv. fuscans]